jgi:Na,K-Atpase Interacting protein
MLKMNYSDNIIFLVQYCLWTVIWVAWNLFVICFYFDVGVLDKVIYSRAICEQNEQVCVFYF